MSKQDNSALNKSARKEEVKGDDKAADKTNEGYWPKSKMIEQ